MSSFSFVVEGAASEIDSLFLAFIFAKNAERGSKAVVGFTCIGNAVVVCLLNRAKKAARGLGVVSIDVFAVTGTAVVVCLLKRAKKAARGSDSVEDVAAIVDRSSIFVVVFTVVITVCVGGFAAVDEAGAPELRENLAMKADLESFDSFLLSLYDFYFFF